MGIRGSSTNCGSLHWGGGGGGGAGRVLKRISLFTDSYSVAFRRQKRGDAEDFGKGMRGTQRVMGRTNSGKACFPPSSPQSFARRLKATGYEWSFDRWNMSWASSFNHGFPHGRAKTPCKVLLGVRRDGVKCSHCKEWIPSGAKRGNLVFFYVLVVKVRLNGSNILLDNV